ncbi:MAG: class IV adenylate cyclase [Ignavibacteriales bacterium]|nr:MAG: class IV adenylate cyclase [Ignavibacteriales bacterium]
MPLNLEVKIKVDSFSSLLRKLKFINAKYTSTLNQRDIYYKNEDALLKLRIENGKESLIRYNRNEKAKNRFSDYQVIHLMSKGTEKFFEKLFDVEVIVDKNRKLYMFDNTRIHLDDIKFLGKFIELETLVINGKRDARKRFDFLVSALDLNLNNQIRKSNFHLMKSYLKK